MTNCETGRSPRSERLSLPVQIDVSDVTYTRDVLNDTKNGHHQSRQDEYSCRLKVHVQGYHILLIAVTSLP